LLQEFFKERHRPRWTVLCRQHMSSSPDAPSSPAPGVDIEKDATTPVRGQPAAPSSTIKSKKPPAKRKLDQQAKAEQEEACKRARMEQCENLEAAFIAAAPSAANVLEILKAEKNLGTLANAITKLASAAKARAAENKARVQTLWPSIEKQLQAQMAFSKNLKRGCQKQLKLEVPMVPIEAPQLWLKQYEENGRIMLNAKKEKKLVTDSASQLKFTADVPLGKGCGWGWTAGSLVVENGLTFTYCKHSRQLTITGKYGLGF